MTGSGQETSTPAEVIRWYIHNTHCGCMFAGRYGVLELLEMPLGTEQRVASLAARGGGGGADSSLEESACNFGNSTL